MPHGALPASIIASVTGNKNSEIGECFWGASFQNAVVFREDEEAVILGRVYYIYSSVSVHTFMCHSPV